MWSKAAPSDRICGNGLEPDADASIHRDARKANPTLSGIDSLIRCAEIRARPSARSPTECGLASASGLPFQPAAKCEDLNAMAPG